MKYLNYVEQRRIFEMGTPYFLTVSLHHFLVLSVCVPVALSLRRQTKYPQRLVSKRNRLDHFAINMRSLTTGWAMKEIEDNNTRLSTVNIRANKPLIKRAVKKMYHVEAEKVNTVISSDAVKQAHICLKPDHDALDVANRIGIISIAGRSAKTYMSSQEEVKPRFSSDEIISDSFIVTE